MQVLAPPGPKPTLPQKPTKHSLHNHQTLNPPKNLLKLPKPNKTTPQKPIKATTKTTTSDILKLLDALNLKIPLDLYTNLIKECTFNKDLNKGIELYTHMKNNTACLDLDLCNWVLIMFLTCGYLEGARKLFDEMPTRRFYTWVVMLIGFVDYGFYPDALRVFIGMLERRGSMAGLPNWVLGCVMKACVMDSEVARQVHAGLVKLGYVRDAVVSCGLVDLYGKLGFSDSADVVLGRVLDQDTVVWTAKIVNECKGGDFKGVIQDFNEMGRVGIEKNGYTFSSVLRACGRLKDGGVCGRQVHGCVIKLGLESESYVECALIDMYGKCGMLRDARKAFEITRDKRNIACWNAMVSSYARHGFIVEAFKILDEMKAAGMEPQVSVISGVKIACGTGSNSNGAAIDVIT